jgi:hypothetical protein
MAPKPKSHQRLPRACFTEHWSTGPATESEALLEEPTQLLDGNAMVYHGLREQR